jgi:N-carbamoylputrescine amidase
MDRVRIALIQLAWQGSRNKMARRVSELAAAAAASGARIVCLPELTLSPYFPATTDPAGFAWAEPLPGGETDQLCSKLARKHGIVVIGSLAERTPEGRYFDTATVHGPDGALIGITRKVHIPSGEGYNETTFFEGASDYPVHDAGPVRLAVPTCYDQWFPEMARISALNGAEFIFYPTAIGSEPTDAAMDSSDMWQTVMRGHAIANGVFIGAANRIGREQGLTFYGRSFVCDPMGRVLAEAGRDSEEVLLAELDPATLTRWRGLFPLLRQRMPQTYARLTDG